MSCCLFVVTLKWAWLIINKESDVSLELTDSVLEHYMLRQNVCSRQTIDGVKLSVCIHGLLYSDVD